MHLLSLKSPVSSVWHKLTFLYFCVLEALYQCFSQLPSHVEAPQGKNGSQLTASWQTLFLSFYDWVHCVPWSCWPGTTLHSFFITWRPTLATQNMASCVFKVRKESSPTERSSWFSAFLIMTDLARSCPCSTNLVNKKKKKSLVNKNKPGARYWGQC